VIFTALSTLLFIVASIFWIWMLIVAATRERTTGDKVVWVLIILLTHVLGAAIYYFVRYAKVR
jgi:hypothetical protein